MRSIDGQLPLRQPLSGSNVASVSRTDRDCHHSKAPFDAHFRHIDERRDLSLVGKACHGALVSLAREGRTAIQTEIADMKGLTRHQTWAGLQELKALGLIRIHRVGLGRPNEYELLGVDPLDLKARPVRKPVSGQAGTGGRGTYKEERRPVKEPENTAPKSEPIPEPELVPEPIVEEVPAPEVDVAVWDQTLDALTREGWQVGNVDRLRAGRVLASPRGSLVIKFQGPYALSAANVMLAYVQNVLQDICPGLRLIYR